MYFELIKVSAVRNFEGILKIELRCGCENIPDKLNYSSVLQLCPILKTH